MIVSLNEIEGTAVKAARGAGYTWGVAEEIGWAARWLASHDIGDVAQHLVGLLELRERAPDAGDDPIRLGLELVDFAWARPAIWRANPLPASQPVWIIPFAARLAQSQGHMIVVRYDTSELVLRPEPGHIALWSNGGISTPVEAVVHVDDEVAGAALTHRHMAHTGGRRVDEDAWVRLQRWVVRTYVPASEESRLKGAGAGGAAHEDD